MPRFYSKKSMFVTGAARYSDLAYFGLRDRKLVEEEVEHSRFIGYDAGQWGNVGVTEWNTVAMCIVKHPAEKMVAMSEDGEVLTFVGGNNTEEIIKPEPVTLRAMAPVNGVAYACGMKREVYTRVGENKWQAMHAPTPKKSEKSGFEAIGGFNESEIYAAGWEGEIWYWNGKKWSNVDSPVNLILTGLSCAPDNQVYICGQEGTFLRGRRDSWESISAEDVTEDFWDIRWFKDRLYLATMTGLLEYKEGEVEPVEFGKDTPDTCGRLTDADGVLWSIGSDDLFAFDGKKWTRID